MLLRTALVALVLCAPLTLATLTDPLQNDAGTGSDAGDSRATATPLGGLGRPAAGSYQGLVVTIDDPADWYQFQAPALTKVNLSFAMKPIGVCAVGLPVPLTPITIELQPAGGEAIVKTFPSPCDASGTIVASSMVGGAWLIGIHYDPPVRGTPIGASIASPTPAPITADGPTVSTQYALVLGCEPYC